MEEFFEKQLYDLPDSRLETLELNYKDVSHKSTKN